MGALYPDVSHYHPVTDWTKAKTNCPFLISKATQGTAYVDTTLSSFISGCESKKIPYWLYAYLNAGGELAQAKHLVSTCRDKVGSYFAGYILDVEDENKAADVQSALDYLTGLGGKTMLYTMYAQYSAYKSVIDGRPETCAWWEARYGKNDGTYSASYAPHAGADLHQYTSSGTCGGISGSCDLNRITGDNGKTEDWFTGASAGSSGAASGSSYTGTYPALPPRGYYQQGDGISTLTNYKTQIKRVQELANWINGGAISVDGQYGAKTTAAVKTAQAALSVTADGKFGTKTLAAAKAYKK